jgi:Rrf2 family transcriptional regulator, cysteine metabolism repressor
MRISAKAEYACFAMLELALNYAAPQPVRVKAIADAHGIPPRFLVQILLQLKGAGLVASVRGASGGYQLSRAPSDIPLLKIVKAIDPPPRPPEFPPGPHSAAVRAIRSVWKQVQEEEERLLASISLAELVRRIQEANDLSYQI